MCVFFLLWSVTACWGKGVRGGELMELGATAGLANYCLQGQHQGKSKNQFQTRKPRASFVTGCSWGCWGKEPVRKCTHRTAVCRREQRLGWGGFSLGLRKMAKGCRFIPGWSRRSRMLLSWCWRRGSLQSLPKSCLESVGEMQRGREHGAWCGEEALL